MERLFVGDAGGDTMAYLRFAQQPQLLCTLFDNIDFAGIRNMAIREDDVILCTYPRCGTHWSWELIRLLATGKAEVDDAEKEVAMFEFNSHGELDSLPSPRVLNTHLWFTQFPAEVVKKKTKLVLVYRNPKDACVSWYVLHREGPWYQYKGEFKDWIRPYLDGNIDWGAYSEWLNQWGRVIAQHPDHPIHMVSYEDLKKDPIEELKKLSTFLGKDYDVSFLQAVSDACSLHNMRAKKGLSESTAWHRKGVSDAPNFMYRKGKAGGWKEWFTVAQSEEFDRKWASATEGLKYFKFQTESK